MIHTDGKRTTPNAEPRYIAGEKYVKITAPVETWRELLNLMWGDPQGPIPQEVINLEETIRGGIRDALA